MSNHHDASWLQSGVCGFFLGRATPACIFTLMLIANIVRMLSQDWHTVHNPSVNEYLDGENR
ncbi:MAG: hypothetical protein Q8N79_08265 [Candidatus Methanoperedens sp.]|nr:hypothetical protein [Candidatus Methanoperedens sp.]